MKVLLNGVVLVSLQQYTKKLAKCRKIQLITHSKCQTWSKFIIHNLMMLYRNQLNALKYFIILENLH